MQLWGDGSMCVHVGLCVLTGPRPELLAVYPCSIPFPLGSSQQMQGEMAQNASFYTFRSLAWGRGRA